MVMLRLQGSIHKAVPLGQGTKARIDISSTAGSLFEFQEKIKSIARTEVLKDDQLKAEKEAVVRRWESEGVRCFAVWLSV